MSKITPAIIFSSASVAVFGSVTVLGRRVTIGNRPFQRRDLNLGVSGIGAALRRRDRSTRAFAEHFSKSQPAGRLIGSSATFSGSPSGRLGVLSTATRLVSRVTS